MAMNNGYQVTREDIVEAQRQLVRGFLHRIVNDTQNKMK
jgi:hypothetical protein